MTTVTGITRGERGLVISPDVDVAEDVYFPVNYLQIRALLGKMLTHVDALGLDAFQRDAVKSLVKQSFHQWWDGAQENSMTSFRGCIAPIELLRGADGKDRKYVWHAEGDHAVSVDVIVRGGSEMIVEGIDDFAR
jgi:hypothetical protein